MSRLVRITTAARLHFGLLDVGPPFGGCGVMIDRPETIVEAKASAKFSCISQDARSAEHQERAHAIAARFSTGRSLPKVELRIIQAAPTHNGLGSGTQLSLAIAEAIALARTDDVGGNVSKSDFVESDTVDTNAIAIDESDPAADPTGRATRNRDRLIAAANRGLRSAVGTHGYFHGGFIAEGLSSEVSSKTAPKTSSEDATELNPLDIHLAMPAAWRAVVLLPKKTEVGETISGSKEQARFDRLVTTPSQREGLKDQLIDEIIPSIQAADFTRFSNSVTQYNRRSGELFAPVQGGPYNGPVTTKLIESLLDDGHHGVGQSSWGPGVFLWFPTPRSAWSFVEVWKDEHRDALMVCPKLGGRTIQRSKA